jgi:hypothetical protein
MRFWKLTSGVAASQFSLDVINEASMKFIVCVLMDMTLPSPTSTASLPTSLQHLKHLIILKGTSLSILTSTHHLTSSSQNNVELYPFRLSCSYISCASIFLA